MDRTKLTPSSRQAGWISALEGLARRVLGASVSFTGLAGDGRRFEYGACGGELAVAATDGVSAAVGLHHYLRNVCGRSVGWDTVLPLRLGSLPDCEMTRGEARVSEFYYLNFCTFSYTMAYWDWPEWEREIDWMALHGVTMPLALTGHEAVLFSAYTRLGLPADAVRSFLGGPGYLPFVYMGCLDSFAGPLPSYWISSHLELGRRILERERAFGMTPVLPAFTGHIPRELAPGRVRTWQGFETVVLDAGDPLYVSLGTAITSTQIELLGTDHVYAADPFIEMIPVDADPAAVAAATLAGLRGADHSAVWLMQAWPFSYHKEFWTDARVREFLAAADGMVVADLWAERDPQWQRFDGFGGKPWLWCGLLNFGGRTDPAADLPAVPPAVEAALASANPPTGLGLSMEAIHNNPVFFELIADLAWTSVDLETWLDSWAACRYGVSSLGHAWRDLLATIYSCEIPIFPEHFHGVLTKEPSYHSRSVIEGALWYDPTVLARAWDALITAAEDNPVLLDGPLAHDLVTVAIAYLTRLADHYYLTDRNAFLSLFPALDALLATHPDFRLTTWESKAVRWAESVEDRALFERNAHQILTTWGPTPHLNDYAARHYSGLLTPYYLSRWTSDVLPAPRGDLVTLSRHLHTTYSTAQPPPHHQTPGQT
ncbi:alpha-N-acetylglucosaminidase TIM-barrel domain-containing protein [Kribbella sp. NPDC050124]|uniref:alpha-N-acetylglucosaminidase n=1 Tax=Kribbella sp. NPDC050124 TaxID=3364114 RepID=UPI00378B54B5